MDNLNRYLPLELLREQLNLIAQIIPVKILLLDQENQVVISTFCIDDEEEITYAMKNGHALVADKKRIGLFYWKIEKNECDHDKVIQLMENLYKQFQFMIDKKDSEQSELNGHFEHRVVMNGNKEDELTGVFENDYFMNRVRIVDRSEVIPVALVCININDWRYANIHFGDKESDRLIQIVGEILRNEAKPDYIIGRTDGDVFHVVIPLVEDGEEQDYIRKVQKECDSYLDPVLSPSVACGSLIKNNVEQHLEDMFDDVQYIMFENKLNMKMAPAYQARLTRKS